MRERERERERNASGKFEADRSVARKERILEREMVVCLAGS